MDKHPSEYLQKIFQIFKIFHTILRRLAWVYAERHGQEEQEERRDVGHDGVGGGDGGGELPRVRRDHGGDVCVLSSCLSLHATLRAALTQSLTAHTDLSHSGVRLRLSPPAPGPLLHLHQYRPTPLVSKPPLVRPRPMGGPETGGPLQVGIDLTVLDLSISVTLSSHYCPLHRRYTSSSSSLLQTEMKEEGMEELNLNISWSSGDMFGYPSIAYLLYSTPR